MSSTVDLSRVAVSSGEHFALILRAARATRAITTVELGRLAGVARSTAHARESGTRPINVGDAVTHLTALGYRLVVEAIPPDGADDVIPWDLR